MPLPSARILPYGARRAADAARETAQRVSVAAKDVTGVVQDVARDVANATRDAFIADLPLIAANIWAAVSSCSERWGYNPLTGPRSAHSLAP